MTQENQTTPDRQATRVRHELRFRKIEVTAVTRLSPDMVRITFGGPDLAGFNSPGFDDHVKLFFPPDNDDDVTLPTFDGRGVAFAEDAPRPVSRDFTPRHFDPVSQLLDIDFALHDNGPATEWARGAKIGQKIGLGGPRGSFLFPLNFDWHLLIGDLTALPAIARRLEEMPTKAKVLAIIEVDRAEDALPLSLPNQSEIIWLTRTDDDALIKVVSETPFPDGDYFAWVACESAIAKRLRQVLIEARGANPKWVRASGYWRRGEVGTHDVFDT